MNATRRSSVVLTLLCVVFVLLSAAFYFELWGRTPNRPAIPPVEPAFTNTSTVRMSGAELVRTGGDASGLDCYACHDRKKQVVLKFDAEKRIILPEEHNDLVMAHGTHNRNNNCFNCHDEANLELLQTRDGRQLKLLESTPLCGSCHGPTYRDWEAGVHGRTSGFWDPKIGALTRQNCVSCHDPHSPKFPPQKPAPGPHGLRAPQHPAAEKDKEH
jgi:hypothetical protein